MYGMRDSARAIFGAKWREKIVRYVKIIEAYSAEHGVTILNVALEIAKDVEIDADDPQQGFDAAPTIMLLMAAAVEMIEPSKD